MENSGIESLVDLIERIEINEENREQIKEIKKFIEEENYVEAINLLKKLKSEEKIKLKEIKEPKEKVFEEEFIPEDEETEENEQIYPKRLLNKKLEEKYIGLLLENPKAISMYYILHEDCYFQSEEMLNIYKSVLFTEGQAYAPQIAKNEFNFAKEGTETYKRKVELREEAQKGKYDFEKTYVELRKLFEIRKNYLSNPIKEIQEEIINILDYELYDQMTIQEVKDAIVQITTTEKFKRAVLSRNITNFLLTGDNSLTTGLELPFPILSEVFKGIRKGETMAYAMPSNSGKSRFTINLVANIAFVHKKKVLIISNEMSEEKMKLCLITTILNNPEIQKLHGQDIKKSEGELLEFKFRPDNPKDVKVDEEGFVLQEENETREQFIKRLSKISTEFNKTVKVTEWLNEQLNNCIYFINITDHTNDELKKVITNYYYKEKIEYMFYDTMKTDTQNIGKSEEIKKTATIISNLAQNLNIFIGYTMQLTETTTLPVNLTINDLSESRTVKEVLDTLCLVKQIDNRTLKDYEYSLEEVSDTFYPLKEYKDPDERYYACVVDKNRAGSKPKVVFNLNLAYNRWTELGYLRLKEQN